MAAASDAWMNDDDPVDEQVQARAIDPLVKPLRAFFRHRLTGAGLLLAAALIALAWAASPWSAAYQHILHTPVGVRLGDLALEKSVHHWINDGVMSFFFFVIGLELKREVLEGELSTWRKAALPALCAFGGMVVPAGLYALVNAGTPTLPGWGVPMATDIAFVLGTLALLGDRVPTSLKVFVTAVAVADDLGAIVVIALFYTDDVSLIALALAAALLLVAVAINVLGVRNHLAFLAVGIAVWLCFVESGVHATLAAVLVAFVIPASTRIDSQAMARSLEDRVQRYASLRLPDGHGLLTPDEERALYDIEDVVEHGTAPLQRLEHALLPLVTFVVLPLFALANAGVVVEGALGALVASRVFVGVVLGLVVGKPLGILLAAVIAVRLRVADLPAGVRLRELGAVGLLAGIGFTMSLFIGELAFRSPAVVNAAKLGTLAASLIAGVTGLLVLHLFLRPTAVDSEAS
ncbi:MAG: Na+/H+ antiporter NhaA [Deltaproteobacteria bacterium]|nr:Na+/H+ antiporter NhaA [Deltaproteobacteria bacterium]